MDEVNFAAMTDFVVILTTLPDDQRAEIVARTLVEERLAACVNLHGPMLSVYQWKGSVQRDAERQVVIKTMRWRVPAVEARVRALHTLRAAGIPRPDRGERQRSLPGLDQGSRELTRTARRRFHNPSITRRLSPLASNPTTATHNRVVVGTGTLRNHRKRRGSLIPAT